MITLPTTQGPFLTFPTGTVTRALHSRGNWDEHVGAALALAPRGGLALDLGAHIGWFSAQLARQHDLVIVVEPHPEAVQALYQNLGNLPVVQVWPVAAYNYVCTLYPARENDPTDVGSGTYVENEETGPGVAALNLDAYLPLLPVHVIKSDCQGADLPALRGLKYAIRKDRPLIVFEFEEALATQHGDSWLDYEVFFHQLNYSLERISDSFFDYVARPR